MSSVLSRCFLSIILIFYDERYLYDGCQRLMSCYLGHFKTQADS